MTEHRTIRFTEIYMRLDADDEPYESSRAEFLVNTRRIPDFKLVKDFAYGYVEELIERALKGSVYQTTGRKYSFGDMAHEYVSLEPGRDNDDPIIEVTVEVG